MYTNTKPLKRSKQLTPLSKEHHDGLLCCWKINQGLANNISIDRIASYLLDFYDKHLVRHFEEEEQLIFPLLSSDNSNRLEAELHHNMLREMIATFRDVTQIPTLSLRYFSEILDRHIRFEERVLFPQIESEATPEALQIAADALKKETNVSDWADQFWIDKKK
ncbi:MAG: hemerythrin domain-containing protein [Bacteroidetes bacterium]|nr:hemerythrin domain-containing protein [Bacteroidota bacterium]